MTPEEQLDFALGQIDDAHRARFEERISQDPALAADLEQIRNSLDRLLDDGEDPLPPTDLLRRTILRVEMERRPRTILEHIPNRVGFRWADIAVAAGIFVAGLLTLLPAVQRSQLAARTAACTTNLRELGVGLIRYATVHNGYPYAGQDATAPYAGTFAIHLYEMGLIDDPQLLDCPSNGRNPLPPTLPCFAELEALERTHPRSAPCLVHCDYAYSLGSHRPDAAYPLGGHLPADYPLVADKPPHDHRGHALGGNSGNHHQLGQNVLFVGGNVRFLTNRRLGTDPDFYRNDHDRTAPGIRPRDYVLGPAISRFDGR